MALYFLLDTLHRLKKQKERNHKSSKYTLATTTDTMGAWNWQKLQPRYNSICGVLERILYVSVNFAYDNKSLLYSIKELSKKLQSINQMVECSWVLVLSKKPMESPILND